MKFNIQEGELPIMPMFNFAEAKLDEDYPLLENDKCNIHMLNNQFGEKKEFRRKDRLRKPLEPGQLVGHWNTLEKKRYHWFLEMHHSHFENKQMRRMDKIFKSMATFIGSRAADQCRSHHQKMEKKYFSFYNIIYNLRIAHYNSTDIEEMVEEYTLHGVVSNNDLINPFPLEELLAQTRQEVEVKEQQVPLNHVHYNFFADKEYEYGDPAFSGLHPDM